MRARRSSIPLPAPRRGRPALRSAARPHLDPRSRSRRRAAVSGCGGTASRSVRCGRCDGVARGPAGASAVGRGGPKGWERAGQALRPQFKSSGARAQPCAARASGAGSCSPQKSIRPAGGLRDEGTTRPRLLRRLVSYMPLAFPVFRAHARAGEGSQGPSGPATRPREAWFSPAVERDSPNGPRASALGRGEGSPNDKLQRPHLRSPSLIR